MARVLCFRGCVQLKNEVTDALGIAENFGGHFCNVVHSANSRGSNPMLGIVVQISMSSGAIFLGTLIFKPSWLWDAA